MESYKDVMLSEPPSRFAAAPSLQPVNLETYKGILLCDRPQAAAARNDVPVPFLPAGRGEDKFIGLQPSTEQRARMQLIKTQTQAKGEGGNAIVSKHKRWLRSFAQAVKRMKAEKVEAEVVAAARAAAFRDKQAKMRAEARTVRESGAVEATAQRLPAEGATTTASDTAAEGVAVAGAAGTGGQAKAKKAASAKAKPAWAMTEDEADEHLLTQHDDLLAFAKNLDYDKFIDDYEIQEALTIMRERVQEIVKEHGGTIEYVSRADKGGTGGLEGEAAELLEECPSEASTTTRAVYRLAAAKKAQAARDDALTAPNTLLQPMWNASTKIGADRIAAAINSEALLLADRILESSESMRRLHTRQTLARLLQEAVQSARTAQMTKALDGGVGKEETLELPTIVTVGTQATGHETAPAQRRVLTELRKATDRTQNLPYLYRCPAI